MVSYEQHKPFLVFVAVCLLRNGHPMGVSAFVQGLRLPIKPETTVRPHHPTSILIPAGSPSLNVLLMPRRRTLFNLSATKNEDDDVHINVKEATRSSTRRTRDEGARSFRLKRAESDDDTQEVTAVVPPLNTEEKWESDSKLVELVLLVSWGVAISAFILINNFVGPWPHGIETVPERVYFLGHMIGGMLFGGGIILTTAIEWLVVRNKNYSVLQFWFDKVPLLDGIIVLPALTVSMISGTGLSTVRYGGLANAPIHVVAVFYALLAFCAWWALTDLTTQGSALIAVNEWSSISKDNRYAPTTNGDVNGKHGDAAALDDNGEPPVPEVVERRTISNVVSCLFVFLIYFIMVMKPGTLIKLPHF